MSENKQPENLLLEIGYSRKRVVVNEYRDGVFKWRDEYSTWRGKPGNRPSLASDEIEAYVTPKFASLLGNAFCGISVEAAKTSDDDTFIRVYKLPDRIRCHRLYCDRHLHDVDAWLRKFLNSTGALHVDSDAVARGRIICDFRAPNAKAAVKVDYTERDVPSPTDHIPALRGLFAFARGNYATVSPEDLTAAVDAGYVHPDVLAVVADEIAHATGPVARVDDAQSVRDQINGDLDKWMKMLGAGIMGHQAEACAVMDAAVEELVRRRANSKSVKTEPSTATRLRVRSTSAS